MFARRYASIITTMVGALLCVHFLLPLSALAAWPVEGEPSVLLGFHETYEAGDASALHYGVDIAAGAGDAVSAPVEGVVSFVGTVPASDAVGGTTMKAVSLTLADGRILTMMPFESIAVVRGDTVGEGTLVGALGAMGDRSSNVAHLHVGLKQGSRYFDPLELLGGSGGATLASAPPVTSTSAPTPVPVPESVPEPVPESVPKSALASMPEPAPVSVSTPVPAPIEASVPVVGGISSAGVMLTNNRLTSDGLAGNRLTSDGLAGNRLTSDGLASEMMASKDASVLGDERTGATVPGVFQPGVMMGNVADLYREITAALGGVPQTILSPVAWLAGAILLVLIPCGIVLCGRRRTKAEHVAWGRERDERSCEKQEEKRRRKGQPAISSRTLRGESCARPSTRKVSGAGPKGMKGANSGGRGTVAAEELAVMAGR